MARYTTEKLDVTKMGGRDLPPSHGGTGRKVIGRVGGGSKQKSRWIDFRRWPKDRDQEEEGDLVERVISINYDPMRKPWIALTGTREFGSDRTRCRPTKRQRAIYTVSRY